LTNYKAANASKPSLSYTKGFYMPSRRTGWKIGKLWYFHALDSPKGIYNLLLQHIQPRFAQPHNDTELNRIVAPYWAPNADQVIALKIKDNEVYTDELRKAFGTDKYGEETYDG
jgi:hypothetical protein